MAQYESDMDEGLKVEARFLEHNEVIFKDALAPYMKVMDLRDNPTAQAEGFDYTGTLTRERHPSAEGTFKPCVCRIELKADTNESKNVCAEFLSQVHTKTPRLIPGWLLTSSANWLFYGFLRTREMLVVPMVAFRAYAARRANEVSATSRFNHKPRYFSYCSLLPLDDIIRDIPGAMLFKLGPVEGEALSRSRTYQPLAHLGPLLAAYPGGILNVGGTTPFDLASGPISVSHRAWQKAEGQKKLRQMLAQLKKKDISARKNPEAHQLENALYG